MSAPRRPIPVRLTPDTLAQLQQIGRPAAGLVRLRLIPPALIDDLAPRRRGEGGYQDADWSIRLSEQELAWAQDLADAHGIARHDVIVRACEQVAAHPGVRTRLDVRIRPGLDFDQYVSVVELPARSYLGLRHDLGDADPPYGGDDVIILRADGTRAVMGGPRIDDQTYDQGEMAWRDVWTEALWHDDATLL